MVDSPISNRKVDGKFGLDHCDKILIDHDKSNAGLLLSKLEYWTLYDAWQKCKRVKRSERQQMSDFEKEYLSSK